jgi:hypothetical protein
MAEHLRLAPHPSSAALKQRYRAADDPVECTHFQVLHMANLSWRSAAIAEATGDR